MNLKTQQYELCKAKHSEESLENKRIESITDLTHLCQALNVLVIGIPKQAWGRKAKLQNPHHLTLRLTVMLQ